MNSTASAQTAYRVHHRLALMAMHILAVADIDCR